MNSSDIAKKPLKPAEFYKSNLACHAATNDLLKQLIEAVAKLSAQEVVVSTKVDELNLIMRSFAERAVQPPPSPPSKPQPSEFTENELDELPWKKYASSSGAWVFAAQKDGSESDDPTIRRLVARLKQEGTFSLYNHKYVVSGSKGQFVARFPP